jgi:hypothetical protein
MARDSTKNIPKVKIMTENTGVRKVGFKDISRVNPSASSANIPVKKKKKRLRKKKQQNIPFGSKYGPYTDDKVQGPK